ncbi:alpha-1,2-fucosyltransferase [Peijinzhouia sedimentorum]
MIVVRLWGGLGNQLFQYATGQALATKNGCELKIDTSLLYENLDDPLTVKREFDLNVFNIKAELATKEEIVFFNPPASNIPQKLKAKWLNFKYPNRVYAEKHFHFDPKLALQKPPLCIIGNWQSYKYFQETEGSLRSELKFSKELEANSTDLANEIQSTQSVCINIRRGDYVNHPVYSKTLGFRGLEYLIPAVEKIKEKVENPSFYIFSDDIKWCEEVLQPKIGGRVIDHRHKGWKFGNYLQLISLCKHQIIPNSTFGWWGAWLNNNPNKIVVAPQLWYQDKSYDTKDLCPDDWIKI